MKNETDFRVLIRRLAQGLRTQPGEEEMAVQLLRALTSTDTPSEPGRSAAPSPPLQWIQGTPALESAQAVTHSGEN